MTTFTEKEMMNPMTIKVKNEEHCQVYCDVARVEDCCDDNGNWARRLVMLNGDTATFPVCEWRFQKLDWVSL